MQHSATRSETSHPNPLQQSTEKILEEHAILQRTCSNVAKKQPDPNVHGRAKKPRPDDNKENKAT